MPQELIILQHCYDTLTNQNLSIDLLLYAHIPTSIVALLFGCYLIIKQRTPASISFFALCALFALWCFFNLNSWASFLGADNMMFAWSLVDLIGLLFFFFSYRFFYAYIYGKTVPGWQTVAGALLIAPTAVATFFGFNLLGYETFYCEAVEDELITLYPYIAQFIAICGILYLGVMHFVHKETKRGTEIILAASGLLLFLLFFFTASFIVDLLVSYTTLEFPYNYEIYGLFGMPVLLGFLGYLIVKYRAFNIKLLSAQALIVAILALTGAEFFFVTSVTNQILVMMTFTLVCVSGYFMVRSVKREVEARERNEELVRDLARVNTRLRELDRQKSEFVSIASHQLRSPLTAIRGYASMILEGSFGKLPAKVQDAIERIHESSGFMALSIEDFLNVSRIEQGRMKYEFADTNLLAMTEKIVDELRGSAIKKGLVLMFRSNCDGSSVVHIDPGKMRQIIYNLIDNSLKYTPKGSVTVTIEDKPKQKRIFVTIKDTGVGMSEETLHAIFDKFVRAKNANSVNVNGTGLGLYVAKQMIDAMGGRITPASEGEGKGSTFTIELPLI